MRPKSLLISALFASFTVACSDADSAKIETQQIENIETKVETTENVTNDAPISAGQLSGLYRNAGPDSPVILIVPGSGPTDLNGNSPLGISSSTYQLLAEALSDEGISTVRVDKRGMFSSADAGDPNAVTVEIYAQDYRDWIDAIRAKIGRDCVYMLGHSEGALMVSAASVETENICGLILTAGMGRAFGDVLRAQLKANPANAIIMDEALGIIETLESGKPADTSNIHPALSPLFGDQVQGFMMSLMQSNPAQLAKAANKKTLIIHGNTDLQVTVEDAKILTQATGGKLVIINGMNHVLKDASISRWENIATYGNPDLPLSEGLIEAIRDFVED